MSQLIDRTTEGVISSYYGPSYDPAPVTLLPVLPASMIDEILQRFGYKPNSRHNLIKLGLFPKGVPLRGRAMTGSLYPSLVLDLIAALSWRDELPELCARLYDAVSSITHDELFAAVSHTLTQRLPTGQPLELSFVTHLFQPVFSTPLPAPALDLDWFYYLDATSQAAWYELAGRQQQLRAEVSSLLPASGTLSVAKLTSFTTGWVDGFEHSSTGHARVVLDYVVGQGELIYPEEIELSQTTLTQLGCDWAEAPIVRVNVALDRYDTQLVLYLPGLYSPHYHAQTAQEVESIQSRAVAPPLISGFERDQDVSNLSEIWKALD